MKRIVVIVEGGIIQQILTDENVDITIIDYDTDGADDMDLVPINQGNGKTIDAYVYQGDLVDRDPGAIDEILDGID